MKNGIEKLDALLRQFMDDEHVHDLKEDLSYADELFATYPTPDVRQSTIAAIQAKTTRKLRHRRYLAISKQLAAVAAVLTIALLFGDYLVNTKNITTSSRRRHVVNVYDGEDLWGDALCVMDSTNDPIERELHELADSIRTVSLSTYGPADTFTMDVMELEEIESLADSDYFGKDDFYVH